MLIINHNLDISFNDHEDDLSPEGQQDRVESIKTGTLYINQPLYMHIGYYSCVKYYEV